MKSKSLILSVVVALAGFLPQSQAALYDFAVLAGSTVTSTGNTVLNGDLGAGGAGASISGFPPGTVNGTTYPVPSDAVNSALSDAGIEYNYLNALRSPSRSDLSGQVLGDGGVTSLTPGIYYFTAGAQVTGTLTLNPGTDPNAPFVFQIGSSLGTTDHSIIFLSPGVQAGNVFWQVGSAATLGANTTFNGNIFADTTITMGNQTSMTGTAFANTGAVTLDGNTITAVPEAAALWPLVFCASIIGAWKYLAVWRRNPESFRG